MTEPSPMRRSQRGIATVAMLKANFDAGRDHLAMFEPFVRDGVKNSEDDDVDSQRIAALVVELHDLAMPASAVRTILNRLARQGFLKREGGVFFRTEKIDAIPPLAGERERIEERQASLADALRDYMAGRADCPESTDDALQAIVTVLDTLHVSLAAREPSLAAEDEFKGQDAPLLRATAAFLEGVATSGGPASEVLLAMLQGYVLQKVLLLSDVTTAGKRFKKLRVIADSQLLFGLLGLRGAAAETSTLELLRLLRDTGGFVEVLEPTIAEMKRVLAVFEDHVRTARGRETLYRTEMTQAVLAQKLTPSDLRVCAATLEDALRRRGITVREPPERDRRWTSDEASLSRALADSRRGDGPNRVINDPRVVHDVDCVAAVLTLRKGRTSASLDDAVAVFVTTSGLTVKNTVEWYRAQGGGGIAPIIHQLALSNAAWLKKPQAATHLQLHELIALCAAALKPSVPTWTAFIRHLDKLSDDGGLSADETTAVIVSELTDRLVVEMEADDEVDATSVAEIVERVKATYREIAESEIHSANQTAIESTAEMERVQARVARQAGRLAAAGSWIVFTVLAAMLAVGSVVSIVEGAGGHPPPWPFIVLALVPLTVVGLCGAIWGFNLADARRRLDSAMTALITSWLVGADAR